MEKKCGPGYASPLAAMKEGPREKLLYVVTVQPNLDEPHGDYLSTIDVDPESPTYSQIIHRTFTNRKGVELHHSGWNTCSSCYNLDGKCKLKGKTPVRDKLILPGLGSNYIYIFDTGKNPRAPEIFKVIDKSVMESHNVSAPHTTHCLANGNVMISTMGDKNDKNKGDFILFDSETWECKGTWTKGETAICGYDFWYQPYFNVMVASEWSSPKMFKRGFQLEDLADEEYGRRLNFYDWNEQKLIQTLDLGKDGLAPLEIRFMHNPKRNEGFVGCCVLANMYYFYKNETSGLYEAIKVIDVPSKKISGWKLDEINGMMSDIILSLDDKFLYFNNWLQGDLRQYDINDPRNPKLVGQVFLGGVLTVDGVKVVEDEELKEQPKPVYVKGRRLRGGPQMLQLSLDGKRMYVSTSLFSPWDKQFYPEMVQAGGTIVQIDIDTEKGGLKINENFLIDFGNEPYGPTLPHEMRYPGGDCTSDIWLADD
uniref:CSON001628 protein n=1 Tax=Culicoides sonorensis TaxID=179676 RepID=A0A336MLL8_CULSO